MPTSLSEEEWCKSHELTPQKEGKKRKKRKSCLLGGKKKGAIFYIEERRRLDLTASGEVRSVTLTKGRTKMKGELAVGERTRKENGPLTYLTVEKSSNPPAA